MINQIDSNTLSSIAPQSCHKYHSPIANAYEISMAEYTYSKSLGAEILGADTIQHATHHPIEFLKIRRFTWQQLKQQLKVMGYHVLRCPEFEWSCDDFLVEIGIGKYTFISPTN